MVANDCMAAGCETGGTEETERVEGCEAGRTDESERAVDCEAD